MPPEAVTRDEHDENAADAVAEEGSGGLAAAWLFFVQSIRQFIVGFLIALLRTLPVLIWAGAIGLWVWQLYGLTATVASIYTPRRDLVPLFGYTVVVLLSNVPAVAGTLWKARSSDNKKALMTYPGVVAAIGLLDLAAQQVLLAAWRTAPLLTLAFPHLLMGAMLILIGAPNTKRRFLMEDLESLMDRFLPPELQGEGGWHAGKIAGYIMLVGLFLVSAWRTAEFLGAVLSGTTFSYMVYFGVAAFDGALVMWHVMHDKASTPAQVGLSTIMWVVALVSMLLTNLGDVLWTSNIHTGELMAVKETLVNVLLLAIPVLTIAHIAAVTVYLWLDPSIALPMKRRRAVGETRYTMINHGAAMTKMHLKAEAARKFAETEAEIMGLLEEAANQQAQTRSRRSMVWRSVAGGGDGAFPYERAGVMMHTPAPHPAAVHPGTNGKDGNPDNIIPQGGGDGDGHSPFDE